MVYFAHGTRLPEMIQNIRNSVQIPATRNDSWGKLLMTDTFVPDQPRV